MNNKLVPANYEFSVPAKFKPDTSENTLKNRINEFIAYKEDQQRRPATIANIRWALTLLEKFIGTKKLSAPLFVSIDAWMLSTHKFSPGTTHLHLLNIRQFFRWCRKMGYMARELCEDICDTMVSPHIPAAGLPIIFTHAQYLKLKESVVGTPIEWAFVLAYHTGLALVDCCHLRWVHVDFEKMWIRCARIKIQYLGDTAITEMPIITDSDLHQFLLRLKKEYDGETRNEEDSDFVCPELMKLYSWKDSNFRRTMIKIIHRQTGPGRSFHTFRRTFVSMVVNSGMSTALACRLTAHSDPKMLMRYLRPDEEALRAGVEKALEDAKNKKETNDTSKTRPR